MLVLTAGVSAPSVVVRVKIPIALILQPANAATPSVAVIVVFVQLSVAPRLSALLRLSVTCEELSLVMTWPLLSCTATTGCGEKARPASATVAPGSVVNTTRVPATIVKLLVVAVVWVGLLMAVRV